MSICSQNKKQALQNEKEISNPLNCASNDRLSLFDDQPVLATIYQCNCCVQLSYHVAL